MFNFSPQLRDTLTRGFCPAVAAPTPVGVEMRSRANVVLGFESADQG